MKKLLVALVLLSGCKKEENKYQAILPPKKPCITKNYVGLYVAVKVERKSYPFTDSMQIFVHNDSAFVEFLGQTKVNKGVNYFTCPLDCYDTGIPAKLYGLLHYLDMKDTVKDYVIVSGTDTVSIKSYVKI